MASTAVMRTIETPSVSFTAAPVEHWDHSSLSQQWPFYLICAHNLPLYIYNKTFYTIVYKDFKTSLTSPSHTYSNCPAPYPAHTQDPYC